MFEDLDFNPFITEMFKNTQEYHARYIPLLDLISGLANTDDDLANLFINDGVHDRLLKTIGRSLNLYQKNRSLFDENSPETELQKMMKYKIFAAEIKTLGGLLNG